MLTDKRTPLRSASWLIATNAATLRELAYRKKKRGAVWAASLLKTGGILKTGKYQENKQEGCHE